MAPQKEMPKLAARARHSGAALMPYRPSGDGVSCQGEFLFFLISQSHEIV